MSGDVFVEIIRKFEDELKKVEETLSQTPDADKKNTLEKKLEIIKRNLQKYKHIQTYIREMKYSEPQIGLFLLGYLIGEISKKQFSPQSRTKPILKKINFQGMDRDKIFRLTNEILEKLDQYKILSYNEVIYAEMKKLIDKYRTDWPLSNEEGVFYVLSGYSYSTYQTFLSGEEPQEIEEGGNNNE